MSVSIIVPFRSDGAERDRDWAFLKARYQACYPDWEIVEGTCEGPWSKGRAVNAAVEASSGDVLVISDADVLVPSLVLTQAVGALENASWVVPHRLVYRLNRRASKAVVDGQLAIDPAMRNDGVLRVTKAPAGGGISVLDREKFDAVGGIDERFLDWGGEDISFARALDTMLGPHLRLESVMWHLYHDPMERRPGNRASAESEALAGRYLKACGDPVAMEDLLDEQHTGREGGGVVVLARETFEEAPMDPRFEGWGQEDQSFGMALFTLFGPSHRGGAPLIHLWHPTPERRDRKRGSIENWSLFRRYCAARFNGEMKGLLEEARGALATHQQTVRDLHAA